ncbi:MAG: hypothetical protein AB1779_02570 [Candidatus Thermoplasmatota archaeon]
MPKKKKEDYEKRIKELEDRIKELEKEKEKEQPSIIEGVVSQFIPGLSGIIRSLEKTSPEFRKRIAETDAKIKHRLETGWTIGPGIGMRSFARPIKPKIEYDISVREIIPDKAKVEKKEVEAKVTEREPIVDVFETEKHVSVIAELPGVEEKDIDIKISGDELEISAGKFKKNIKLPAKSKGIIEKTYKHGILELKMEKGNGS